MFLNKVLLMETCMSRNRRSVGILFLTCFNFFGFEIKDRGHFVFVLSVILFALFVENFIFELWLFTLVFLVTKPFWGYQQFLTWDLNNLWNLPLPEAFVFHSHIWFGFNFSRLSFLVKNVSSIQIHLNRLSNF